MCDVCINADKQRAEHIVEARAMVAPLYVSPSLPVPKSFTEFVLNLERLLFEVPLQSWMGVSVTQQGRLKQHSGSSSLPWARRAKEGMQFVVADVARNEFDVRTLPTGFSVGCALQRAVGNGPKCIIYKVKDGVDAYAHALDELATLPFVSELSTDERSAIVAASDGASIPQYIDAVRAIASAHGVALARL